MASYFPALIITLLCISVVLSGVCVYFCYCKKRKLNDVTIRRVDQEDRIYGGISRNIHRFPYHFYMRSTPDELKTPSSRRLLEAETKDKAGVSFCTEKETTPTERPNVHKGTSWEKRMNSCSRLYAIQETEEHEIENSAAKF